MTISPKCALRKETTKVYHSIGRPPMIRAARANPKSALADCILIGWDGDLKVLLGRGHDARPAWKSWPMTS